jgi:hypothetical protein
LAELSTKAKTPSQEVEIYLELISAQFDATPSIATHMPTALWRSTYKHLVKVLEILEEVYINKTPELAGLAAGVRFLSLTTFPALSSLLSSFNLHSC